MFLRQILNATRSGLPSLDQHKDWETSTTVVLFFVFVFLFFPMGGCFVSVVC